ncbi:MULTISPECIES: hypothetical protein [unclassified Sphingomonas]|jgi:hypothetical protein|uniref:hypothetical protein n=1 Tax=unclassified Sphingomonas TaxID=196159 RepID=UPI0008307A36|nr:MULTISPECIES: hypothetical protein [unclassified Sphingomonas]
MTIVPSAGPLLALMLAMQGGQGDRPAGRIQWDALPQLDFRVPLTIAPEMTAYVAGESRSGRCPPPAIEGGRSVVRADVAVLVQDGMVRATIPHAIDCVTVEQYAAGIVVSYARNNLTQRMARTTGWYRATLVFEW